MTTIFTDIIEGREDGHIIYEDEKHVVILDKYPIDHGHSLVITRHLSLIHISEPTRPY